MTEGDPPPSASSVPPGNLTFRLYLEPQFRRRLWRLPPLRALGLRPAGGRPHAEVWLADPDFPFPLSLLRLTPGVAVAAEGEPLGGLIGRRRRLAAAEATETAFALVEGEFVLGPERGALLALDLEGPLSSLLPGALDLALALPPVLPPGLAWGEKVHRAAAEVCAGEGGKAGGDEEDGPPPLGLFAARALACRAGALAAALSDLLALSGMEDPEPVHEARVALRRMRAVLSAFAPLFRGEPALERLHAALKAVLRRNGRLFARARDFDVFYHGLLAAARRLFPEEEGRADLAALVAAIREEAYAELRRARAGEDVARLLSLLALAGGALRARAALSAADPRPFAASRLAKRAESVFGTPPPAGLSPEERHQLRLAVKRLRYAAEMFAPLFPGGRTRRLLRRLSRLQDWLGHANDARTTLRLLEISEEEAARRGLVLDPKAKGIVLGLAAALEPRAVAKAERLFAKLIRRPPFWEIKKE